MIAHGSEKLRVGVLVDLKLRATAGGHVKCWEHFAEAATRLPERLDLTVHFAGDRDEERPLSDNVRYRLLRPSLSSALLRLKAKQPDYSDLAPIHWRLHHYLGEYDVLHSTDAWFAYARTAMSFHQRHGKPLVMSTHTDVPHYTQVFTRTLIQKTVSRGRVRDWLLNRWRVPRRLGTIMQRRFDHYLAACDQVLASSDEDYQRAMRLLPADRVSRLRRGIDKDFFHPQRRNRPLVEQRYRIPSDRFLLLFVGRLDEAKLSLVVAKAARLLIAQGAPVHAVFVGQGPARAALLRELGRHCTVLRPLPHEELRDIYASADLFVFPSTTEVMPNVVIEAKTCGLPVLVSRQGGSGQLIRTPGEDGLLMDDSDPAHWAATIEELRTQPERRRTMGEAARRHIETEWPSWDDVLQQDLLPVWERVAQPTVV